MKLNTRWALPIYPIFKDEKSNGLDEESSKRKTALTKNSGLITATNFVWERSSEELRSKD